MPFDRKPWFFAAAVGVGLWCAVVLLTGRAEAWDSGAYWVPGYPLLMAATAGLGWMYPDRPWRWGLVAGLSQAIPMLVVNGFEGLTLLPLTLIAFGLVSLPLVAASAFASRLRRSRETWPV
ncbi:MAG TPA: hypothetical protein VFG50_03985 [Rhodothermales bacterium]|nr:hypothetical protein [Rhodothermales bacterium]